MFITFSTLGLLFAAVYLFIIAKYLHGWRALPEWRLPPNFVPRTKVSVIVPARNEEANILACLHSLASQNFPAELFEVIVVDDHSTDGTASLVNVFSQKNKNIKLLRLADFSKNGETQSFKKAAIETAIAHAAGELIATTDADCVVPPDWLRLLVSFYRGRQIYLAAPPGLPKKQTCREGSPNKFGGNEKFQFIAAPVNFHHEKSTLERFQSLDFIGMMGVTGAGIHLGWMNMCNGANLAYTKTAFHAVGGFSGIDHLASGDDILLMQKMAAQFPGQIGFLKNADATVRTEAKPDWPSFFSQRLRWATKSANYQEWKVTLILAVVLFYCLGIVGTFFIGLFWGWPWLVLSLFLFLVKTVADYFFLSEMSRYFGRQDLLKSYLPSQFLHLIYIVSVGIFSNLKKRYEWKGRQVK